jgi:hypothetical protein
MNWKVCLTRPKSSAPRSRAGSSHLFDASPTTHHRSRRQKPPADNVLGRRSVETGGLMSYGADRLYTNRRVASMVDKILKGRKPADIPVEQPMKFEFIINLKTAQQINLTIPPNVLVRADKVIK